jgi:hypothetical protein
VAPPPHVGRKDIFGLIDVLFVRENKKIPILIDVIFIDQGNQGNILNQGKL